MQSADYSDYEKPSFVVDLNKPVDQSLHSKFDFIFDGGTIEHVFNVPVAFASVFDMLQPGGTFVTVNGLNSFWAHGMYQFGPELIYSYWKRAKGCVVERCRAVPTNPDFRSIDLPDPEDVGGRLQHLHSTFPKGSVYLYAEIRKGVDTTLKTQTEAYQSDYVSTWKSKGEGA